MKKEFCDVIKLNFAIGFLFLDLLIPPPPEQQKTWLIRDKRRDRIPIDPLTATRPDLHQLGTENKYFNYRLYIFANESSNTGHPIKSMIVLSFLAPPRNLRYRKRLRNATPS